MCAWRGVEDRERARFFALVINNVADVYLSSEGGNVSYNRTVCKKSERSSERNFHAGEISRPRQVHSRRWPQKYIAICERKLS